MSESNRWGFRSKKTNILGSLATEMILWVYFRECRQFHQKISPNLFPLNTVFFGKIYLKTHRTQKTCRQSPTALQTGCVMTEQPLLWHKSYSTPWVLRFCSAPTSKQPCWRWRGSGTAHSVTTRSGSGCAGTSSSGKGSPRASRLWRSFWGGQSKSCWWPRAAACPSAPRTSAPCSAPARENRGVSANGTWAITARKMLQ